MHVYFMALHRCILRGNPFLQAILMALARHRSTVLGNRNRKGPLVAFDVDEVAWVSHCFRSMLLPNRRHYRCSTRSRNCDASILRRHQMFCRSVSSF